MFFFLNQSLRFFSLPPTNFPWLMAVTRAKLSSVGPGGRGWLSQAKGDVCLHSHSPGKAADSVYGPEPSHAGNFTESLRARRDRTGWELPHDLALAPPALGLMWTRPRTDWRWTVHRKQTTSHARLFLLPRLPPTQTSLPQIQVTASCPPITRDGE